MAWSGYGEKDREFIKASSAMGSRFAEEMTAIEKKAGLWDTDEQKEVKAKMTDDCYSAVKPPLGIMPRILHVEHRLSEINGGIDRFLAAEKKVPVEWINEYNELIDQVGELKKNK
jgi:hypothetical protein